MLLPIFTGLRNIYLAITGEKVPDNAPPAPPTPPTQPDIVTAANAAVFGFAEIHPIYYLIIDFGVAFVIGALFLFWKDITDWIEKVQSESRQAADRAARQAAMKVPRPKSSVPEAGDIPAASGLALGAEPPACPPPGLPQALLAPGRGPGSGEPSTEGQPQNKWAVARAHAAVMAVTESSHLKEADALVEMTAEEPEEVRSAHELKSELRMVNDKVEELEIKTKVHKKSTAPVAIAMREELKQFLSRRDELQRIVHGVEVSQKEEEVTKKKKKPDKLAGVGAGAAACLARAFKGPLMQRT